MTDSLRRLDPDGTTDGIETGKIIEEGSHAQLIQQENGLYAKLFKLQSGGFIIE